MSTELTDREIIAKFRADKKSRQDYMKKRNVWKRLMIQKAEAKGIEVSDEEVKIEMS